MVEARRQRRRPAMLVSSRHDPTRRLARRRARVVRGLRSVARRSRISGRARRSEVLLCGRAASYRPEILEVAALLQTAAQPVPALLEPLERLLRDGCHSPLYNPDVQQSELGATLYHARAELQTGLAETSRNDYREGRRSCKPA
jgi:hypothetical protein